MVRGVLLATFTDRAMSHLCRSATHGFDLSGSDIAEASCDEVGECDSGGGGRFRTVFDIDGRHYDKCVMCCVQ